MVCRFFERLTKIVVTTLESTPLEIIKSVDMMRVLEYGKKMKMIGIKYRTHPENLKKVEGLIHKESC